MHQKMQKQKKLTERKLKQVTSELDTSLKKQEELKFELSVKDVNEIESQHDQKQLNALLTHCQALVQENSDKSNIIIALQARLLAVNEDRDEINRNVDELQMKNKNLMQQVKDLTINYDFQRTRSITLLQKYNQSNDELSKSSSLNRELHLAKFNLTKTKEDNETLNKKLDEYRNVVTALNAKFCLLQEQQEVEYEKRSEISEEYFKIRQQAKLYEMERDQGRTSLEQLREKTERLEHDVSSYREQIELLTSELDQASINRNRAIQEREEVIKYNNELLKSRDEAIRNHVDISKKLESKYHDVTDKLGTYVTLQMIWVYFHFDFLSLWSFSFLPLYTLYFHCDEKWNKYYPFNCPCTEADLRQLRRTPV